MNNNIKNDIQGWMFLSGVLNTFAYPLFINMEPNGVIEGLIFRLSITIMALTLLFYGIYIIKNIDYSTYIFLLRRIRAVYPFTWRFVMRKKGRRISPFTKSDFVRWGYCFLAHLCALFAFVVAFAKEGELIETEKYVFIAGWVAFVIEAITTISYDLKKPNPQG